MLRGRIGADGTWPTATTTTAGVAAHVCVRATVRLHGERAAVEGVWDRCARCGALCAVSRNHIAACVSFCSLINKLTFNVLC